MKRVFTGLKFFFKTFNYRHYICLAITIGFVLVTVFVFPYAPLRIGESFRDLGNSFLFYLTELFGLNIHGTLTVTQYSSMPYKLPFNLPSTWTDFQAAWHTYWQLIISAENFQAYSLFLVNIFYYGCLALLYRQFSLRMQSSKA